MFGIFIAVIEAILVIALIFAISFGILGVVMFADRTDEPSNKETKHKD